MEAQDERKEQHAAASTSTSSQDLSLPKAVLKRLIKSKLASMSEGEKGELQISSDALMAFGESAKVFISYIAATSNDIAREGKRQTISVQDVHRALEDCDFDDFLGPLEERILGSRQQQAQTQVVSKKAKGGGSEASTSNRGRKKRKGPAAEEQGHKDGAGPEEKGAAGWRKEGKEAEVEEKGAAGLREEGEGAEMEQVQEGEAAKVEGEGDDGGLEGNEEVGGAGENPAEREGIQRGQEAG